eukprot:TRINITY_DN296_c0_g1_i2.p1 TRINITY_DN296_c0_g1~~TRINITY_DN296_c0_g1_i2.p1  ORF type:complete len:1074 (+),score=163.51 TRINITY_DN296_c0_g1_i2:50-3271(+)
MPCKIDIFVLIAATAILSTLTSIAGALIMHFNSLDALQDTVEEVSLAELQMITNELTGSFEEVEEKTRAMMNMFYSGVIKTDVNGTIGPNDTERWVEMIRTYQFGVVKESKNIQSMYLVLFPYEKYDDRFITVQTMFQIRKDKSREYISGVTGPHEPESLVRHPPVAGQTLLISVLHPSTGAPLQHVASIVNPIWTFLSDLEYFGNRSKTPINVNTSQIDLNDYDDETLAAPPGWRRTPASEAPATLDSFRSPRAWTSFDQNPFVFLGYDRMYKPPPAPHPWSAYHVVWASCAFAFDSWDETLLQYAEEYSDTDIVIADTITETVYSTSFGIRMLDLGCMDIYTTDLVQCSTKISNMSSSVQSAWNAVKDVPGTVFKVVSGNFVRKSPVQRFGDKFDIVAMWMRATSTINEKVESALWLMVGFISFVFVIDVFLIYLERWLIVNPVLVLCESLASLQTLRITDARKPIADLLGSFLLVKQIEDIASGIWSVSVELDAYKEFLPVSILNEETTPIEAEKQVPPGLSHGSTEGEATVLFTDVEGSTYLWEVSPSETREALSIHNKLARQEMIAFGGYEVKTLGDSFMITFSSPLSAIQFALKLQEDLAAVKWPSGISLPANLSTEKEWPGLRVRIGIHHGTCKMEQSAITGRWDYFGGTVNKTSRIQSSCPPGGILVSRDSLNTIVPCNAEIEEADVDVLGRPVIINFGETSLKGFTSPVSTFLLVPRDLKTRTLIMNTNVLAIKPSPVANQSSLLRIKSDSDQPAPTNRLLVEVLRHVKSVTVCKLSVFFGVTNYVSMSEIEVHQLVSDTFTKIMMDVELSNGVILSNSGSSVLLGWNALKSCQSHHRNAIHFCSKVATTVPDCAAGVCSGPASCGRIRGMYQKFQAVIGPCVHVSDALAFNSQKLGACLYTSLVSTKSLSYTKTMRPVDVWRAADGKRTLIYQIYVDKGELDCSVHSNNGSTSGHQPGWSESYWEAFFTASTETIENLGKTDPVLKKVAELLGKPEEDRFAALVSTGGLGRAPRPESRSVSPVFLNTENVLPQRRLSSNGSGNHFTPLNPLPSIGSLTPLKSK